ncbi:MAG TPA: carboxypeptidase-like regulatory domain-containing protein [Vicinamibacterales bacterium]|nr:carboxypeptidase-like regulatory domain-containing protein [Vicinamibacterales bacterium]
MTGRFGLSLGLVVSALSLTAQIPALPAASPPPTNSALITGRVLDANGSPAGAVVVALSGRGQPQAQSSRVLTDAEGRFFFSELAAGNYSLTATKAGWIPGAFGRNRPGGTSLTVDLTDGERRGDITIAIWRYAVVSGRVTDDAGDPMVDADVRAFQQAFYAGRRHMTFAARARTDDRGMFRFASLLPGEYVIVVPATVTTEPAGFAGAIRAAGETPRPYLQTMTAVGTAPMLFDRAETPSATDRLVSSILAMPAPPGSGDGAWMTYPTTFYPSVTTFGSAATVRADSGAERSGVDVTLRLTPTYQVSGTLMGPDGAAAYHAVHLLASDSADVPLVDAATPSYRARSACPAVNRRRIISSSRCQPNASIGANCPDGLRASGRTCTAGTRSARSPPVTISSPSRRI